MKIINSIKQTTAQRASDLSWKEMIGIILAWLLAVVLAVAGITKLVNSRGLIAALQQVPFLNYSFILWIATLLPVLEIALAAGLFFRWKPRFILPAVFLLFTAFLGFSLYGWIGGLSGDCGCFGNLVKALSDLGK